MVTVNKLKTPQIELNECNIADEKQQALPRTPAKFNWKIIYLKRGFQAAKTAFVARFQLNLVYTFTSSLTNMFIKNKNVQLAKPRWEARKRYMTKNKSNSLNEVAEKEVNIAYLVRENRTIDQSKMLP